MEDLSQRLQPLNPNDSPVTRLATWLLSANMGREGNSVANMEWIEKVYLVRGTCSTDTQPSSDFSGVTMDNRYQFLNVIGCGAYGKVFKAVHLASPGSPFVAIKCMKKAEPSCREATFQNRELNLHSKLTHPNIVRVQDKFDTPDYFFLVMDFCDGGDRTAAKDGRFYNQKSSSRKLCVYHQDLKLENVLLGHDGHVYLADFGLAGETALSKDNGCGTVRYLSREALGVETNRLPYSAVHSDIWALGIISMQLVTGHIAWITPLSSNYGFATFKKRPRISTVYQTLSISEGQDIVKPPIFHKSRASGKISSVSGSQDPDHFCELILLPESNMYHGKTPLKRPQLRIYEEGFSMRLSAITKNVMATDFGYIGFNDYWLSAGGADRRFFGPANPSQLLRSRGLWPACRAIGDSSLPSYSFGDLAARRRREVETTH
ncbi:kinase-like domain-containing protein [Mycena floridula]|nr:kinase-like domain-containing protein [Mycena floridula]